MAHLKHDHLIVRADIKFPPGKHQEEEMNQWFRSLIQAIKMNILIGPFTVYCDMPGNKGFTGICAIETSSITLHCWCESKKMQLDVYSCAKVDMNVVLEKLHVFGPTKIDYLLIDRDDGIRVIDKNQILIKQQIAA